MGAPQSPGARRDKADAYPELAQEGARHKILVSPLVLLCLICQWCALVWYVASYIPFGQKIIKSILGAMTEF